jgi:hypothetical protein
VGEVVVDDDARLGDRLQPPPPIALETALEQPADRGGRRGGQPVPVDVGAQHVGHRVRRGLALEQAAAGQHLEQHDTVGPDVGSLVDERAARLLRAHVGDRAHDDPGAGRRDAERRRRTSLCQGGASGTALESLGQAEIEHLHLAVRRDLHVGGLEVAVDDAFLVRGLERIGHLLRDAQRLDERDRPPAQAIGEVLALHQLHDQRCAAAGFLETVDARDVRMTERGEDLRLAVKARHALFVVREVLGQQLQRDIAVQARVGRTEHLSHAASSELAGYAIVRQGLTNHAGRFYRPARAGAIRLRWRKARG